MNLNTMVFLDRITCHVGSSFIYNDAICRWPYLEGLLSFLGPHLMLVMLIVISAFLERHSKEKRTRAPAYSRGLMLITSVLFYTMFNGFNKKNWIDWCNRFYRLHSRIGRDFQSQKPAEWHALSLPSRIHKE